MRPARQVYPDGGVPRFWADLKANLDEERYVEFWVDGEDEIDEETTGEGWI